MTRTARITLASLFAALPLWTFAQEKLDEFNPVQYAIISQTISPDARGASLGDAGAATDPDVNSQHWNPAKYPFTISRAGVALNYTPWLRQLVNDIDQAYLAGYYRIGEHSAVSGSLRYFSLGEVQTSAEDNAMTVNPYEMAIAVRSSPSPPRCAGSTPTCAMTTPVRTTHRHRPSLRISRLTTRPIPPSAHANVSWPSVSTSRI